MSGAGGRPGAPVCLSAAGHSGQVRGVGQEQGSAGKASRSGALPAGEGTRWTGAPWGLRESSFPPSGEAGAAQAQHSHSHPGSRPRKRRPSFFPRPECQETTERQESHRWGKKRENHRQTHLGFSRFM